MIKDLSYVDCVEFPYKDGTGCSWESRESYLCGSVLGFCGCGVPYDVMMYVKDQFERIKRCEFGEYSDIPYMFFVYWGNEKGFLEHGTSVRCSWLTELGVELLHDIDIVIAEKAATDGGS